MMISPKEYYECSLKGKPQEEILTSIRSLKKTIGHLKKVLEIPEYESTEIVQQNDYTQLVYSRLYLARAIQAYEEAGGKYEPSKQEMQAIAFDKEIPDISKITLEIGGFFNGYETRIIHLHDNQQRLEQTIIRQFLDFDAEQDFPLTKEDFLEGLRGVHIGEWHHSYYNNNVLDGTQWELTIEYNDGRKKSYYGSNAYPFSFNQFRELMGFDSIDKDEDGEIEDEEI